MTDSPSNFLRTIIEDDLRSGRVQQVVTRFPPEPNGYLHIGHAKAICTSFGLAEAYDGRYHLRFDDTNPLTEETEYVEGIQRDIRWLGFDWGEHLTFASDTFEQLFEWAKHLIRTGHAYVDEQSGDEIRETRGTVEEPGTDSPWRDRPAEESLALLDQMNSGDLPDGAMVLRAKIDMASPNMKLRDPVMYRIRNAPHHRTGTTWKIYPLYDWAHGQGDAIEGITHSLCSLEFDVNRPLYDWYIEHLPELPAGYRPHQYEFARLNLTYTVMSKRRLIQLVRDGHVSGWDDPRMPTLCGLRRRGVPPEAIRSFIDRVGVAKANSVVDPSLLDHAIRDSLNHTAPRRMAVLDPLEVEITTWPEGAVEQLVAQDWPHDVPKEAEREVPFTGRLYIERDDFAVDPPKGWRRLSPGAEVRLRYGYYIRCDEVVTNEHGDVVKLRCSHDPTTRGGSSSDGRKVAGTLHWVSADRAVPIETRLVDRLFSTEVPGADGGDFLDDLNPEGLITVTAHAEPHLRGAVPGTWVQLERLGYFVVDPEDSHLDAPVLIRTAALKDSWGKSQQAQPEVAAPEAPQVVGEARALPDEARADADALVAAGTSEGQARVLATEPGARAIYDAALEVHPVPRAVASWVVTELRSAVDDLTTLPFSGQALGSLVKLVDDGTITGAVGKQLLGELIASGGDPRAMVEAGGLARVDDSAQLQAWIDEVLATHPDRIEAYKGGKTRLLGFFIGQVMQKSQGRADAQQVRTLLQASLDD